MMNYKQPSVIEQDGVKYVNADLVYVAHILRYGSPDLGRRFFGVFTSWEKLKKAAKEYNDYRGGKYPAFEWVSVGIDEEEKHPKPEVYWLEDKNKFNKTRCNRLDPKDMPEFIFAYHTIAGTGTWIEFDDSQVDDPATEYIRKDTIIDRLKGMLAEADDIFDDMGIGDE